MHKQQQVDELKESYENYLERLVAGTTVVSELLHNEDISAALKQIIDFSNGMEWLLDAAELLKSNEVTINLDSDKIISFLKEINEGLEKKDYVLVADIFEYEISEYFQSIVRIEE